MIVTATFDYEIANKIKAMSAEDYATLRNQLTQVKFPDDPAKWYGYNDDFLLDMDTDGAYLTSIGLDFKVKKFKGNMYLDEKIAKLGSFQRKGSELAGQNITHIHLPSIGLLLVDEVTWLEDACTEDLQSHLNDGWRILAVCPPNLQRRPDYILGRANPTVR